MLVAVQFMVMLLTSFFHFFAKAVTNPDGSYMFFFVFLLMWHTVFSE